MNQANHLCVGRREGRGQLRSREIVVTVLQQDEGVDVGSQECADLQQPIGVLGVVGEVIGHHFDLFARGAQRVRHVVKTEAFVDEENQLRLRLGA